MKTIVWILSGTIMLLGAAHKVDTATQMHAMSAIISLIPDDEPIVLRGHVGNMSGANISGADVKLKKNGVVAYSTTTNSSGNYQISAITSGNYNLTLSATGYVPKGIPLSITAEINRTDTLIAE